MTAIIAIFAIINYGGHLTPTATIFRCGGGGGDHEQPTATATIARPVAERAIRAGRFVKLRTHGKGAEIHANAFRCHRVLHATNCATNPRHGQAIAHPAALMADTRRPTGHYHGGMLESARPPPPVTVLVSQTFISAKLEMFKRRQSICAA